MVVNARTAKSTARIVLARKSRYTYVYVVHNRFYFLSNFLSNFVLNGTAVGAGAAAAAATAPAPGSGNGFDGGWLKRQSDTVAPGGELATGASSTDVAREKHTEGLPEPFEKTTWNLLKCSASLRTLRSSSAASPTSPTRVYSLSSRFPRGAPPLHGPRVRNVDRRTALHPHGTFCDRSADTFYVAIWCTYCVAVGGLR